MTHRTQHPQFGFTLIELVIVLGITGLIFSGLWGLLTSGSSQLQAQTVAQQYRQVLTAAKKYAESGVYDTDADDTINTPTIADLTAAKFLSNNFPATDAYGTTISIKVITKSAVKQQWQVVVYSGIASPTIPDKVGAQISSLIGSEGGFVYANATDGCSTTANATQFACGSFNSFAINVTAAPISIAAGAGRIVVLGYTVDTNAGTAPWLYRKAAVAQEQNTMQQDMFFNSGLTLTMAGSGINMVGGSLALGSAIGTVGGGGKLTMNGGNLSMGADAASSGGGALYLSGATINDAKTINGDDIKILPSTKFTVTSGGSISITSALSTNVATTDPSASAVALDINGTGRATEFQAGKFIYGTSDVSLKENLKPLNNSLEKLLKLQGYYFDWKGANHTHDVGLIAQEVQKEYPELITKMDNGKLGIDYAKMVAPIIEAIRDLKKENEALKKQVEILQQQTRPLK